MTSPAETAKRILLDTQPCCRGAPELPYWRDPALPEGWIYVRTAALIPNDGHAVRLLCEWFRTAQERYGPAIHTEVYRTTAYCGLHIYGMVHPELIMA